MMCDISKAFNAHIVIHHASDIRIYNCCETVRYSELNQMHIIAKYLAFYIVILILFVTFVSVD